MSTPAYISRPNQPSANQAYLSRIEAIERTPIRRTLLLIMEATDELTVGRQWDVQLHVPFTIMSWTLLADASGDIVVDIWRDAYVNYPPTIADSITGGSPPEISGDDSATDDVLAGWDRFIEPGDTLRYNIDSVSGIARCSLVLELLGPPL